MVGAIPIEILIRKEELIIYDEKAKLRTMKYLDSKREQLKLNLPLGTKEIWRGLSIIQKFNYILGGIYYEIRKYHISIQQKRN